MDRYFKNSVIKLPGYGAPPQEAMIAKLNQNESPFDLPAALKQDILDRAAALSWNRYPVHESPDLKTELARWHNLSPDQFLLGNGSNQLLQTILSGCVEPGEQVLCCPPTFSLFEMYIELYGGEPLLIPYLPGNAAPEDQIVKAIQDRQPKIVLFCSPNNPTGSEFSPSFVEKVCHDACGLVVVDEAYAEFSEQTFVPLLQRCKNLVLSRTFSKAFSMAGLRLGYLMADAEVIAQWRKVNLPYNVNLFTELVGITLLAQREVIRKQVDYIIRQRNWMLAQLTVIPEIKTYPSAANFLLFSCPDSKALFNFLKGRGILVRDVSSYYGLDNHLRVNAGYESENQLFLNALLEYYQG